MAIAYAFIMLIAVAVWIVCFSLVEALVFGFITAPFFASALVFILALTKGRTRHGVRY